VEFVVFDETAREAGLASKARRRKKRKLRPAVSQTGATEGVRGYVANSTAG
jgi:hypothetical protein